MATAQATVEYREIPGHPGYRVGDDGSVWSCRQKGNGFGRTKPWTRIKQTPGAGGYLRVELWPEGKKYLVHRLVLEAFVGPCPEGMEACHDPDPDPANNRPSNLRWATKRSNFRDRDKQGRTARGERSGKKLTEATVRSMRADHASGRFTQAQLARKYGVRQPTVSCIVLRQTWKHVA